ncbi:serine/threonine protein kinase [Fragilaria crotonensis]|nr:serine/threonine protein kinase [Fragilaria crotonensis]
MTPRPFNKGDVLVKKGDVGDAFYVIREGKVAVRDIEVGGKACEDMVLGPGDFFGERALVTQEPRMANCVASTPGIALCVDRDTFSKVMGNMQNLVLKATDKRLLEALKVFKTTPLDPSDFSSLAELIVDIPFEKGQVVFQEGHSTSSAFYIIRDGQVRLTSTTTAEYNNKILNKGGFFGGRHVGTRRPTGCRFEVATHLQGQVYRHCP